eukprot:14239132-Alexandrium_andersonii.AAC.1
MKRAIEAKIAFRRMFMFMEGGVRKRGPALASRVLHLVVGIRPRHSVLYLTCPRSGGARKRGPTA